jgi:hypothetical protein
MKEKDNINDCCFICRTDKIKRPLIVFSISTSCLAFVTNFSLGGFWMTFCNRYSATKLADFPCEIPVL